MTFDSAEQAFRARLPLIRFLQAHIPLRLARWLNRLAARRVRLASDVQREEASADGVPCEWLIPHGSSTDQIVLYLHGGGFVYELTALHIEMVAHLMKKMGVRALMVDYRVGPEHPFPAALDDCVAAYKWLLKPGISARNVALAGDSAGANLAITTMMKLRDDGTPLPAAAACLSPVADLSERDSTDPRKAFVDPLIPAKAAEIYNRSYVAQSDPRDPLISPVFGDWHGLPPLLVHAGEDEMLRNDAVRVGELANCEGGDVRVEIYPRMWHVWQLFLALPQAAQSLDDIAQFLKSHLPSGVP